jgi:hypothetical protein
LLQSGDVLPQQCVTLSYGRGLDHLTDIEILPFLDELGQHGAEGLWTVLDIISMYLFGGKAPSEIIAGKLKQVILMPSLFEKVSRHVIDGSHLEQAVSLLEKSGHIDGTFASLLVRQLLNICRERDGRHQSVFHELDEPIRSIFKMMIEKHPSELWTELSHSIVSGFILTS